MKSASFSANGISLRLSEAEMKLYERSFQVLLSSAPRGFAARTRFLCVPNMDKETVRQRARLTSLGRDEFTNISLADYLR